MCVKYRNILRKSLLLETDENIPLPISFDISAAKNCSIELLDGFSFDGRSVGQELGLFDVLAGKVGAAGCGVSESEFGNFQVFSGQELGSHSVDLKINI